MAEALKRQYDIIVLKTELVDRPPSGDNVRFTLQCKLDGVLRDFLKWQSSTEALGLPDSLSPRSTLGQGPPLTLPPNLLAQLADFMWDQSNRDRPLWIHLVKPYGALRLIPWEQLLGRALDVPILMLPDFIFPPPRETKSMLEVAVCGSAPLGHEAASVYSAVEQAVDLILDAPPRPTRVHVFTDSEFAPLLRDRWRTSGHGDTVAVHDNQGAAKYDTEDDSSRLLSRPGMIRSPWLSWLGDALRGRSVDVVHFVCHGYMSHDRGAMLFAQSPLERTDRYRSGQSAPRSSTRS